MKKLVIMDTDALIHRGYHALPSLSAKGEPTNAIFGFFSIFIKMIQTLKPDYLIAALDTPAPTFRKKAFDDYKAHRPKTPDELISQLVRVKKLLGQIGILTLAKEGFEADDVIGTVAAALSKKHKDLEVIIVTGDLDTLQLVQKGVKVYTMRKGMSDTVIYDKKAVIERYGLTPSQLPDYKGLVGDASDNIPGVSGVGPKTASALLQKYKNLETLFKAKNLPPKLQGKKDEAMFSRELSTINCQVPVAFTLKQALWKGFDQAVLGPIFSSLGFSALLRRIDKQPVIQDSHEAQFENNQTTRA